MKASAATVDRELTELLDAIFQSATPFGETSPLKIAKIRSLIQQLQKTNRVEADKATADLETFFMNYEGATSAARNIKALGANDDALETFFRIEANFLNASEALKLARNAVSSPSVSRLGWLLASCINIGAFITASMAIDSSREGQRVITDNHYIPILRRAADVLQKLGVSEEEVAACINIGGVILQRRKLLWLNRTPDVHITGDTGGELGIAMEFRLPVSAEEASKMTWEWCEQLIEEDLYKSGVTFGFVGVR